VKLETVRCEANGYQRGTHWHARCIFTNVTFNKDTKLKIERDEIFGATDEDFDQVEFHGSSSVPVLHRDILRKFPNTKKVTLEIYGTKLNGIDSPYIIENCGSLTYLSSDFNDYVEISSDTLTDCKKLETIRIKSDSLTDLPDGLFKNQQNLQNLDLEGKNLKLRVSPFEGLTSLTNLRLESMDLSQIENNFFRSLKIKTLEYYGSPRSRIRMSNGSHEHIFPIESLNSQETIEGLTIIDTNLSQIPETLGPTLRSMKQLKGFSFFDNLIGSVEAFVDLPKVESINLSKNNIKELPANAFKGCPRLTSLTLSLNPIKVLRGDEFNQLSGLKELSLWNTKLASIGPTTFHPLTSLEQLYIGKSFTGENHVISKELFMNSTNLKLLDLSLNQIEAIHPEAFSNLHKLTRLDLERNKCVDFFSFGKVLNMTLVKEKLKDCFKNFTNQKQKGL
jgi:Leucine-rich repeat (LRR) protein